jgi:hypothetical protein
MSALGQQQKSITVIQSPVGAAAPADGPTSFQGGDEAVENEIRKLNADSRGLKLCDQAAASHTM